MKSFIFPNGNSIRISNIVSTQFAPKVEKDPRYADSKEIKDRIVIRYEVGSHQNGRANDMVIECESAQEAKGLLKELNASITIYS